MQYKKKNRNLDWNIAKLVGVDTYSQLIHSCPKLYEPFKELTNNYSLNDIVNYDNNNLFINHPPNLVSTLLVDSYLTPVQLKKLLIKATMGDVDPRIETLINSSNSYSYNELELSELFIFTVKYSLVFSLMVGFGIVYMKHT
jgi:hypothetical protein